MIVLILLLNVFNVAYHKENGLDVSLQATDTLCSSYLDISNSHTHTYLSAVIIMCE